MIRSEATEGARWSALDEGPSIERASVINVGASVLSKGLNYLALSVLVAYFFGATASTDAFLFGALLPLWAQQIVVYGLNACFIPVFVTERGRGEDGARIAAGFGRLSAAAMGLVVVVGILLAPTLASISLPKDGAVSEIESVYYMRWMFVLLAFGYPGAFLSSLCYARRRYLPPALGQVVNGLGLAAGLLILHPWLGLRSILAGMGLGLTMQLLVLLFFTRRDLGSLLWKSPTDYRDRRVRRIFGLLVPIVLGGVTYPIFLLATRWAAASVGEGALASLDFGSRTVTGFTALLSSGVGLAVLPQLSRAVAEGGDGVKASMERFVRTLALPMVPLGVGLIVLGDLLVESVFSLGAMSEEGARMVRQTILFLAPGVLLEPLNASLTHLMFSRRNTWRLLKATSTGLLLGLVALAPLTRALGLGGIALSIVVGQGGQLAALAFLLGRDFGLGVLGAALRTHSTVLACALPGAALVLVLRAVVGTSPESPLAAALRLAYLAVILLLAYAVLVRWSWRSRDG